MRSNHSLMMIAAITEPSRPTWSHSVLFNVSRFELQDCTITLVVTLYQLALCSLCAVRVRAQKMLFWLITPASRYCDQVSSFVGWLVPSFVILSFVISRQVQVRIVEYLEI